MAQKPLKLLSFCPQEGFEHSPITSTTSKMFKRSQVEVQDTRALKSVLDIESVTKGLVERSPLHDAKLANHLVVNDRLRNRHEVVARNDANFGQTFCRSDFNFRPNTPDRAGDRCARHGHQDLNGCISRHNAHRSSASRFSKVRPNDVTTLHHAGIVCAASLRAASTMVGS